MKAKPPGVGSVPKASTGKCGPGMGSVQKADNTSAVNPTASAGGKGHPSLGKDGGHESYKNSTQASEMTSFKGKLNRVSGKW